MTRLRIAQPVLGQRRDVEGPTHPEVGVQQRFERDRDGRGGQQQRQEVQHREQGPVFLPAGGEYAEQHADRGLDDPADHHHLDAQPQRCPGVRVGEHRAPVVGSGPGGGGDAVPAHEAQAEDAEQRDDREQHEDDQRGQCQQDGGALPPGSDCSRCSHRRGGHCGGRHQVTTRSSCSWRWRNPGG